MILGRVVGKVWSTVKNPNLEGQRMLIVQPVNASLEPTGKALICLDTVGAGAGELVYYCGGRESSFPFLPREVPTDRSVVAIVDEVRVDKQDSC
jgi:ethanolamine utilization protein EutN